MERTCSTLQFMQCLFRLRVEYTGTVPEKLDPPAVTGVVPCAGTAGAPKVNPPAGAGTAGAPKVNLPAAAGARAAVLNGLLTGGWATQLNPLDCAPKPNPLAGECAGTAGAT